MHAILEEMDGVEPHSIFLRDAGFSDFSPWTRKEEEHAIGLIRKLRPQLVGFHVKTSYVGLAARLSRVIKDLSPQTLVLWGGMHPTLLPDRCVPDADILCLGEGEDAFRELVTCLRDQRDYSHVQNLWVKQNGKIVKNPQGALRRDLDAIPFPAYGRKNFYFIEANQVTTQDRELQSSDIHMLTGRGCPFACSYCFYTLLHGLQKGLGPLVRRRSVNNVLEELKTQRALRPRQRLSVVFFDENFLIDEGWLAEFAARYPKEIGLPFSMQSHPQTFNQAKIRALMESGVTEIRLAIESGSERIRKDVFDRKGSNQDIIGLSRELARHRVPRCYYLIIDNPYETLASLHETVRLLFQLPEPFRLILYKLKLFPRLPLMQQAIRDGKLSPEEVTDSKLYHQMQEPWRSRPRLFPADKNRQLLNIIWLMGFFASRGRLDSKRGLIEGAVFGDSLKTRFYVHVLSLEAIVLGMVYEYGGVRDRADRVKRGWALFLNTLMLFFRGDWGLLWAKIKKRITAQPERQ